MYTKLSFPINLDKSVPMPITEDLHEVIVGCGYDLLEQGCFSLQYQSGYNHDPNAKRLSWRWLGEIRLETSAHDTDRGWHWTTVFECRIRFAMNECQVMEMLQSIGAIDYRKLPEYKEMVNEVVTAVREKNYSPSKTATA